MNKGVIHLKKYQ